MTIDEKDPIDVADETVLADLRELAEAVDPMPADLPDAVKFALTVRMLHAEAAAITHDAALAVRSTAPSTTGSIAFSGRSVELLVSASDEADGSLRIDGWVTPATVAIEVHTRPMGPTIESDRPLASVVADAHGRFVLGGLRERRLMFLVRSTDPLLAPTITPIVEF